MVKQLLKKFPKFNQRQFANTVTDDKTWVYYFKLVGKIRNKSWLSKHGRWPVVAKRTMSTKKVKSVTGQYYLDVVLKQLKKYYQKRRPVTGFQHVYLLHDNAPDHTSGPSCSKHC